MFTMLCVFRSILGFGIGGEYPLSATISSESSDNSVNRIRMTGSVLSMQGFGSLTAACLALLLYTTLFESDDDLVWRLSLGLGAVPAMILLVPRICMTYKPLTYGKVTATEWLQNMKKCVLNLKFLGTAGSWFLFDVTFYANSLFSTAVLSIFHLSIDHDPIEILKMNVYIALMALPGYWVGVYLVGKAWCGLYRLQCLGFIGLTTLYLCMAIWIEDLKSVPGVFLALYGLSFFFSNAGPNVTTFILPTIVFEEDTRATCHGLSAAAGKIGAAIGAAAMAPMLSAYGIGIVLYCCSGVAFLGLILSIICRNYSFTPVF